MNVPCSITYILKWPPWVAKVQDIFNLSYHAWAALHGLCGSSIQHIKGSSLLHTKF
jgi:hypothetical protein